MLISCAPSTLHVQEEDLSETPACGSLCCRPSAALRPRAGARVEIERQGRQEAFILSASTVLIRSLITQGNGAPGEKRWRRDGEEVGGGGREGVHAQK